MCKLLIFERQQFECIASTKNKCYMQVWFIVKLIKYILHVLATYKYDSKNIWTMTLFNFPETKNILKNACSL